jgi:hypothetical protein
MWRKLNALPNAVRIVVIAATILAVPARFNRMNSHAPMERHDRS